MTEERLLRFAAPALYRKMAEVFSTFHIHPYDVHAILEKQDSEIVVSLKFAADFSQSVSITINKEQAEQPDETVIQFFSEAAERCKSLLIADYYKMMKL